MAHQYGVALRNNQVAAIQTTVGGSGVLKIFSGAEPATCATADPTGLLATITLPATFLSSTGGATTLAGTWSTTGSAAGTPASYRIYDGSAVCHVQGNTSTDLVLSGSTIAVGQAISVTTYGITAGNA